MKAFSVVLIIVILGLMAFMIIRAKQNPKMVSLKSVLETIEANRPRTKLPKLGEFYLNNATWWQETPSHQTPEGKPIHIHFDLAGSKKGGPPTEHQVRFCFEILDRLPRIWPALEKSFRDYLHKMEEPAKYENSEEWEIDIGAEDESKPREWTISFKIPDSSAAWYQIHLVEFESEEAYGTY